MKPGDPEWERTVTASKVSAILGVSPWQSQRAVWHAMRGEVAREPSNESQRRGHYLEPAILAWWRDQHDAALYSRHQTYRLDDWAAATPDATAVVGDDVALIEAKTAASDDDWGDPGTDVIPAYYLTQVYFQLALSGAARCYVPVLTSRLRFVEYVVEANAQIQADLIARMREWWERLATDDPPPLDDSVSTFDVIRKLHKDIEPREVEIPEATAVELVEAVAAETDALARARLARTTVIDLMGSAQYATCNGYRVARRQPNKTGVSFVPVARDLRFTVPQETAS